MTARAMTYLGLLLGLLAFVGAGSLYTVNQIQQVIILQFGKPVDVVKDPGLHWKLPFIWDVEYYDKRVLDFNLPLEEPTTASTGYFPTNGTIFYSFCIPIIYRLITDV